MDWTQEKCLLLIEVYRNSKCLWDPNSFKHYKNTARKQDAWKKIANQLECNVEEAKRKMDSLLASYRRERQKTKKSGTYHSKWFAFKSMRFLMDIYKPRKNDNMAEEQENERSKQERGNGVTQSDCVLSTKRPQPSTSLRSSHTIIPSKKSKPEDSKDPRARVDEAYCILKDTYESKMTDRSQAFGNHVASKHREYSKRTKAYVEHSINNILFDADLGKFDFEPRSASPPMSSYSDSSQNGLLHSVITDQITTVLENSPEYITDDR